MRFRVSRRRLLVVVLAVLFVFVVIVPGFIAYSSLHPERCAMEASPGDFGLRYEDVGVVTGDGVRLSGWVIPGNGSGKGVVVIMHGYTSCKGDRDLLAVAAGFVGLGYDVVMFDFRGHGESEGTTTIGPREARFDAPAIIGFASERFPGEPVILVGYSMGGVVAIVAGSGDERVSVIVADSPYPVLSEVVPRWLEAKMGVPVWYSRLIGVYGSLMSGESLDFGPMRLDSVDRPLLVIVGTEDPLVTPDEAWVIASKSVAGDVLVVDGAGHVEAAGVLGLDVYLSRIDEFIINNSRLK